MLWMLPLALSAAGAIAQNAGANQARKAQQGVYAAEVARQRGYQDAANAALNRETDNFRPETVANDLAATDATRGAAFQGAVGQPVGYQPIAPTASAPDSIAQVFSEAGTRAKANNEAEANRAARAGSIGDWLGERGRSMLRTGQEVGQQNSFMRGSSNVLPVELDAAQRKGQTLRSIGGTLGGIGNLAALYTLFKPDAATAATDDYLSKSGFGWGGT